MSLSMRYKMSRMQRLSSILLGVALCCLFLGTPAECFKLEFLPGEIQVFPVRPNDSRVFTLWVDMQEGYPDTIFVMIQLHTQIHNMTLSTSEKFGPETSKTGTNVGFTNLRRHNSQENVRWYLKVNSSSTVKIIGVVKLLTANDPLPGGCNQVFNMPQDPSVLLTYRFDRTHLLFQWANVAAWNLSSCESTLIQNNLDYSIYVYYVKAREFGESNFFEGLKHMMDADTAKSHGRKIVGLSNGDFSKPELDVTSEAAIGAIYTVVVTRFDTKKSAVYVAGVTYACDFLHGECNSELRIADWVLCGLLVVVGLFLIILGHLYFKTSQFCFGFIFGLLLTYILMNMCDFSELDELCVAAAAGIIAGGVWLLFWWKMAFPTASVFVPGLCAGYVLSAAIFFTPFANISWWDTTENYALCFACLLMLYAVVLLAFPKWLNIVSCALVGSCCIITGTCLPLASSMRLVFLYSLYRQTRDGYGKLEVFAPFQLQDMVLAGVWVFLVIFSFLLQAFLSWGKPAFDHPKLRARGQYQRIPPNTRLQGDGIDEDDDEDNGDERRRLVPQQHHNGFAAPPSYESVQHSPYVHGSYDRSRGNLVR